MPLVHIILLALLFALSTWRAEAQVRFPDQSQLEMLNEARRALADRNSPAEVLQAVPAPKPPASQAEPEAAATFSEPPPPVAHNDVTPPAPVAAERVPVPAGQPSAPARPETHAEQETAPQLPVSEPQTTPAPVAAAPVDTTPPHETTSAGPNNPVATEAPPEAIAASAPPVVAPPPVPVSAIAVKPPSAKGRPRARCRNPEGALGVARVVEIDTTGGPIFGRVTRYVADDSFLKPKEVVLTFDDGPAPAITRPLLDTLDRFCTKATFFQVGRMALAHPEMAREVLVRGHTVGGHTWSHPRSLNKLPLTAAKDEVERGFAAVTMAVGQEVAPFFRFPGLGDGAPLLKYFKSRGIGTFSVDVISDDSFISSSERLAATVLSRLEQRQRGIILFHDIKPQTARALPIVLQALKDRGYRIVHLKARQTLKPDPGIVASLQSSFAASREADKVGNGKIGEVAIYGSKAGAAPPVTTVVPPTRRLERAGTHQGPAATPERAKPVRVKSGEGWATTVHRPTAGGEASP